MLGSSPIIYIFVYVSNLLASRDFYERALGFQPIEEDSYSVKYNAGHIILALNQAENYSITLNESTDDTSQMVFHVDDIDVVRSTLESRGVTFTPTLRYDIGATAGFYDRDGHFYNLYEPSQEAMTWPSADKIRAVLSANGEPRTEDKTPSSRLSAQVGLTDELDLGKKRMIYLFLFVRDVDEAFNFYHESLGLRVLEDDLDAGVIKYDCGGIILATHLVGGDSQCAVDLDLTHPKSLAPVFYVTDLKREFDELSAKKVQFKDRPRRSAIGSTAKFTDPNGHTFFLYQPSAEALSWPSGGKVKQIINAHA